MSTSLKQHEPLEIEVSPRSIWQRRLSISLTVLVWTILGGMAIWIIGHAIEALVLFSIAAVLGYIIYPLVQVLQRVLPRLVAIILVYLIILSGLCVLIYVTIISLVAQLNTLIPHIQEMLQPGKPSPIQPLLNLLYSLGITRENIFDSIQQLVLQLREVVKDIVPLLQGLFSLILNIVLVTTISIYLLIDGKRIFHWLQYRTPLDQRQRIRLLMDILNKTVGGYIRGTFLVSGLVAILTGLGTFLLGVPYPFLLAILTFFLAFIPIVGTYLIVIVSLLFALPQGWVTMLLVAILLIIVHSFLRGQILGPRIIGEAVGLHPIIAILALVVGGGLFGLLGALFAVPVVGVILALIRAFWSAWKVTHPDQFPPDGEAAQDAVPAAGQKAEKAAT